MDNLVLPNINKKSRLKEALRRDLKEEISPRFSNSYNLPSLGTEHSNNEVLRPRMTEGIRNIFKSQTKSKKTQFSSDLKRLSIDCLDFVHIPATDDPSIKLASARETISRLERELDEKNAAIVDLNHSANKRFTKKSKKALAKSSLKNSFREGELFLYDLEKMMNLNKNKYPRRNNWLRGAHNSKQKNLSMQI